VGPAAAGTTIAALPPWAHRGQTMEAEGSAGCSKPADPGPSTRLRQGSHGTFDRWLRPHRQVRRTQAFITPRAC
jgi:hypothetical protein